MDVVINRDLLARARRIARVLPLVWPTYRIYWQLRRWREARRQYSADYPMETFGSYPPPLLERPVSQLCTSEQMISSCYDQWCDAMHSPARFSRKQWEFVYILQALSVADMLKPGRRGLGFGCGREPLAGLFAQHGCNVLATDLEAEMARQQGWAASMQHASSLEGLYECAAEFVSRQQFYERVAFRSVDMNAVPPELHGRFDFVWSACAFEHLGTLRQGMEFVKNSVQCLKPGGMAVHTTEFNLSSQDETLESPSTSIYRAKDIRQLVDDLGAEGFEVAPLNLNTGSGRVDDHIDLPPYGFSPHIKLLLEGFVVTSIGLIIRRSEIGQ